MRLGVLVGRFRLHQLAAEVIDVVVTLAGAVDAVGPVQPGVEPLGRVRRRHLARQHVAHLVEVGPGVRLAAEIAALPAPVGPGAGQPVEELPGAGLAAETLVLGQLGECTLVRHGAPQEFRDTLFLHFFQALGDTGLAEILLRQHVGRDLAPGLGDVEGLEPEHHRAVRIPDLGGRLAKGDGGVGRLALLGELAFDPHASCPSFSRRHQRFGGKSFPVRRLCSTGPEELPPRQNPLS